VEGNPNTSEVELQPKIEYYLVPLELYRGEEHMETDLYMYYQGQYILYKSKGQGWTPTDTQKLSEFGVSELFVKFDSRREHHQYLEEKLASLLDKPNVSIAKKAAVLYELSDPILSTIYTTPESAELVHSACGYVKNCIKYLNDRGALPELVELSCKTLTEHTHALHVSTYAIALAKRVGFQSYEEVFALGMGGLLHDIGKSKIDVKILNKPGELDDEEWLLVRQHPKLGEDILDHRQLVPVLSKRIVAEHHERVNGKGYPRGIKNIHVFSKIVGIADVFNSLTSTRPYAGAMKPFDALKLMIQTMKHEFDPKLLAAFIEMLSK